MSSSPKPEKSVNDQDKEKKPVVKDAYDLQRLKLEKLMKNPTKPVILPETSREKKSPHVPEFVRNVMGSSAGAGSGEFHVYRHLRRKEHFRQKFIQEKAEKDILDEEYHKKLELNKQLAEERTAKKRAKRLKKKAKRKKNQGDTKSTVSNETSAKDSTDGNVSSSGSDD
ncbi:unnamed protein product [Bemisia tabaci]|uniref:PRKR-interacting protein 1 n=1 Tax=Bemisia tabaci TaxID=7038 RepID=A0A9P0C9H3_BEMTA|nr:unnamed protein product [Bemisia tabaci]